VDYRNRVALDEQPKSLASGRQWLVGRQPVVELKAAGNFWIEYRQISSRKRRAASPRATRPA
jgi:hypothetical protein